jgi:membrane protein
MPNVATLWSLAKESALAWTDDFAPSMGAAIAYYTAFSIAPLLVIVLAIAGLVFGREAAEGYLFGQMSGLIGADGGEALQTMVQSASSTSEGIIATLIGLALLLLGSTTVFAELQSDLDRIWKAPAVKAPEGLWGLLRSRVLSFGMVVSIGFLMLVSLVLSAALAALSEWWGGYLDGFEWLLHLLDFVVSLGIVTLLFALMYKILPRVKIAWRDVWVGALVTSVLFAVGKVAVGLYIGKAAIASSFGTAGALAVLLIWVYYSAQIFLLGAEFTWAFAHRLGSRRNMEQPATAKEALATTSAPSGDRSKQAEPVPEALPTTLPNRPATTSPLVWTGLGLAIGAVLGAASGRDGRNEASDGESPFAQLRELLALFTGR